MVVLIMSMAHSYVRSPSQMPCHSLVQRHCSSSVASQSLWPDPARSPAKEARKKSGGVALQPVSKIALHRRNAAKSKTEFTQTDGMLQLPLY